jgi:hypothetical protein
MMLYRLLSHAVVAGPLRQQRNVAMQLAIHTDALHNLAPIHLEAAVEVVQRKPRNQTRHPVEEATGNRLTEWVLSVFLPPAHEVVVSRLQLLNEGRDLRRFVLEIRIHRHHVLALRPLKAHGQSGRLAVVALKSQAQDARLFVVQGSNHLPSVVPRAVVNDQHTERQIRLGTGRPDAVG